MELSFSKKAKLEALDNMKYPKNICCKENFIRGYFYNDVKSGDFTDVSVQPDIIKSVKTVKKLLNDLEIDSYGVTREKESGKQTAKIYITEEESIEIIPEISDEEPEETVDTVKPETEEIDDDDDDVKLEKLLSAMTPLEEDSLEEPFAGKEREETVTETSDIFDATLEQLATEFIETQDKIAAESKSSTRSKIGKLRNILPFKQSKHKDNSGLGDLFGWAGMAANDEDFSVPGFFTSAASKK